MRGQGENEGPNERKVEEIRLSVRALRVELDIAFHGPILRCHSQNVRSEQPYKDNLRIVRIAPTLNKLFHSVIGATSNRVNYKVLKMMEEKCEEDNYMLHMVKGVRMGSVW